MTWLYLLLLAHFINAVVFILAKYFVSGPIPSTRVYVFYESIFSLAYIVLVPFGVQVLPPVDMVISLSAGFIFSISLLFLYSAIRARDISGVAPAVGAMTAIFTLLLSFVFLGTKFTNIDYGAFTLLVLGTFTASNLHVDRGAPRGHFFKEFMPAIVASLLFGLFYVMIKFEYNQFGFLSPFFWTRIGMALGAVFILLFMNKDKVLFRAFQQSGQSLRFGFIATKLLAGTAFLLIAIAAYLGNVALVNAMQGLQYMFLITISFVLVRVRPGWLKEGPKSRWSNKLTAVVLIVAGLVLLGLGGQ